MNNQTDLVIISENSVDNNYDLYAILQESEDSIYWTMNLYSDDYDPQYKIFLTEF